MRSVWPFVVWTVFVLLLGLCFSVPDVWVDRGTAVSIDSFQNQNQNQNQGTYNYDRLEEVKKECKSVLSPASELKIQSTRTDDIKQDLGFENGDWSQLQGEAPIMPFDVRFQSNQFGQFGENSTGFYEMDKPLNLVSFWVQDVSRHHRTKNTISVAGMLSMAIVSNGGLAEYVYGQEPQFRIWPGQSQLAVPFEGVYSETEEERVLCMLGTAMLPDREVKDGSEPWKWVNESSPYGYSQTPLLQDDKILLVLRYPKTFTLTSRVIRGQLKSLNPKSSGKYFDEVSINSQMGVSANYEFSSRNMVSKACNPYPYKDDSVLFSGVSIYKENRFCEILEEITRNQFFTVLPNWNCSGTDGFCDKLGPFGVTKEINATNGGFNDVSLHMQVIKCEPSDRQRNGKSARVSATFRAIPPSENRYSAYRRSGDSNMTVAAEGIWNSTSGQLCMVGCRGLVDDKGNGCDSRICLYIPVSFSLRQRSIIFGTFSSISTNPLAYPPLSVERLISQTSDLWNYFHISRPTYTYTVFSSAGAFLEKKESYSFQTMIKKSLLTYPKLEDKESLQESLAYLLEDLSLHTYVRTNSKDSYTFPRRARIQLEILSVGPLFGQYWSNYSTLGERNSPYQTKTQYSEKQLLLNVSAHLTLEGSQKEYKNVSSLFLEGLYDQRTGKMYMLGCRDVRASWEILSESGDLEDGMDCLIEAMISYPSTAAQWLTETTASISISSKRNDDDPLRFSSVELQTLPIVYRKEREDLLSRRGVEGILRIVTLSLAVACILSQLFHIKNSPDTLPYTSLVMLGVQVIGYVLPLVTDAEALFKKTSSENDASLSYNIEKSRWIHILDYAVKLLVMASLLLTLRLCQKVWKSRSRLLSRHPREPHRVPSDKKVLITTVAIHVIGYILVLVLHSMGIGQKPLRMRVYESSTRNSGTLSNWESELEEYFGLVQDFYLLPQVIGNLIWQIDNKPLRKLYYFGLTVVRLLPHLYDRIRPATQNPYYPEEFEFVDPSKDFFSKFPDIAIPITAIVLAILVYIQQRWNYEKLSGSLTLGRYRLLPRLSLMYEKLPSSSKVLETELTSNGNASNEREHDLE